MIDAVAGGAPVVKPDEAAPENSGDSWACRAMDWLACMNSEANRPWMLGVFAAHVSGGIATFFFSECPWGCLNLISHVALGVVGGHLFSWVFLLSGLVGYCVYCACVRTEAGAQGNGKGVLIVVGICSFAVAIISSIFLAKPITSVFFHAAACATTEVFGSMTICSLLVGFMIYVFCAVDDKGGARLV